MIEEYNSIAKNINSKPLDNRVVKLKDYNRLSEIYSYMSEEQKQVSEPLPSLPNYDIVESNQQKATPEEVAEYNKLAKQINSQDPSDTIIRQNVVERLKYLQNRMSNQQKANAEPFPNFPPPPPTPPNPESKTMQTMAPPPPQPVSTLDHIENLRNKDALFFYNNKAISGDEAIAYVKRIKELYISTEQIDSKEPKVYISSQPTISASKTQDKERVMVNGTKPINDVMSMTRAQLIAAQLSVNGGEIISFKLKIPGKPTQSIKGNVMDAEAKTLINGAYDNDATQIFMIKDSDGIDYPPITILIKETKADLKQSYNLKQYLLERDRTSKLLKNPTEYPGSFLEMSDGDQRIFQAQYMKMHRAYSKLTELEKKSAPKMLPPAPDPKGYILKNGKIIKKNQ